MLVRTHMPVFGGIQNNGGLQKPGKASQGNWSAPYSSSITNTANVVTRFSDDSKPRNNSGAMNCSNWKDDDQFSHHAMK